MENPYYYLTAKASGAAFRIGINDVPLAADADGGVANADIPINGWLAPTQNHLTIELFWPSNTPFSPGLAKVQVVAYLSDPASESPKPKEILATFQWPVPSVPESYPYRTRLALQIGYPITTELWRQAETIYSLADSDKHAILDELDRLRGALADGDHEKALGFVRYKVADLARAQHHDISEMEGIASKQMEWMLSQPDLMVLPLMEEEAVFEIVGQGRLVHVVRKTVGPALSMQNETRAFGFDVYLSRIGGQWKIVR